MATIANYRNEHAAARAMMFSKRHYEYLADWLRDASMAVADIDRRLVASSLADRLSRDNPRFDRKRFLAAAGASGAVLDIAAE
jgi:hypothetical protein